MKRMSLADELRMGESPKPKATQYEVGETVLSLGKAKLIYVGKNSKGGDRFLFQGLALTPNGIEFIPTPVPEGVKQFNFLNVKGGPGSGNHGHRGRPGEVGGSMPSPYGRAEPIPARAKLDQRFISKTDTITHEVVNEPNRLTRRKIAQRKLDIPIETADRIDGFYDAWNESRGTNGARAIMAGAEDLYDLDASEYPRPVDTSSLHSVLKPTKADLEALYLDHRLSKAMVPREGIDVYRGIRGRNIPADEDGPAIRDDKFDSFMQGMHEFMRKHDDPEAEFMFPQAMLDSWTTDKNVAGFHAHDPDGPGIRIRRHLMPNDVFLHHEAVPLGVSLAGNDNRRTTEPILHEAEVVPLNRAPILPIPRKDIILLGSGEYKVH